MPYQAISTNISIWSGPKKKDFLKNKKLFDHILNLQGRSHMMAHRGPQWNGGDRFGGGERFGGGNSRYEDDSHSAFLELRAGANPLHHPLQHPSLDRRPGASQHFPLSAR